MIRKRLLALAVVLAGSAAYAFPAASPPRVWTITVIAQDTAAGTVVLYLDQLEQLVQGFNARGRQIEELNKMAKGCS